MTSNEAIAVDFSQETATSSIILPPHLSSHQADWTGIYLQYHDCPSHETPEHYPTQHVVAIQTKGFVEAERKLGDRFLNGANAPASRRDFEGRANAQFVVLRRLRASAFG